VHVMSGAQLNPAKGAAELESEIKIGKGGCK
jgi:hypothetical protein